MSFKFLRWIEVFFGGRRLLTLAFTAFGLGFDVSPALPASVRGA